MFCPNCGTENTKNLPACEKCGTSFGQPSQPVQTNASFYAQPQPEKKSNVAKIVIILAVVGVAVIILVGIIAAIAIPSLLNARRKANQNAAMATCRKFSSCARGFAMESGASYYWEDGTTDFGMCFTHFDMKNGYNFGYFSNCSNGDEATSFMYVAVPISYTTAHKAFFIDETGDLYQFNFTNSSELLSFEEVFYDIDWSEDGRNRLINGSNWTGY